MLRELVVPIALLGVLASLLLPLPSFLLDFLLVGNIILALVLFVSTLYISNPLKLSALPSILLLATLYRLALNISTTRMILGTGDAGAVIQAFGRVVIQGNLVVGTVIFLVITLIQFIVIAKGSERVAEVSARFTLDALPGKQMSIDADVRSGIIDVEEAKCRRDELQLESRFYGALDGAMKFVKGDAIAGIVITGINIIGGFLIGVLVNGSSLGAAASQYTLLTIGDGLLSQIPALLQSLAAGMIVTRVVGLKSSSLSLDLMSQIGQVRKVKFLIGMLAFILAVVPGMPFLPFFTLGVLLVISGFLTSGVNADQVNQNRESKFFTPSLTPVITFEIGIELARKINGDPQFVEMMEIARKEIFESLGLLLLPPQIKLNEAKSTELSIVIHGILAASKKLKVENLELPEILSQIRGFFLEVVNARYPELIDDIHTRRLLDYLEEVSPELVSNLVPQVVTVTVITEICKQLAREGIPIKQINLIIQAIAESAPETGPIPRLLLERVRASLHRLICNKYQSEGVIQAYSLDQMLDIKISRAERDQEFLDPDVVDRLVAELGQISNAKLILCSGSARRLLKECLELRDIAIPVMAHRELSVDMPFQILGVIGQSHDVEADSQEI